MEFVKRHPLLTGFGTLAIIIVLAVVIARANQSAKELSLRALRNYHLGYLEQARNDIERALAIDPDDEQSLLVAASISMEQADVDQAREHYARIETPRLLDQHTVFGEAAIRNQQMELAEQILKNVRARRADHDRARNALFQLYRMSHRRWEHRVLILEIISDRSPERLDSEFLFGLINPYSSAEYEYRESNRDLNHPDRVVRLTACVNHVNHVELGPARDALQQLVSEHQDFIEAHARLGLLLVQLDDVEGLREWFMVLPKEALTHPDCCYAAGVLFENVDRPADARTFYHQALSIDYRHQGALQRLTGLLNQTDEHVLEQLRDIAAVETELDDLLKNQPINVNSNALDVEWGKSVLELLLRLGWLYEAKAWCGLFHDENAARFAAPLAEIESRLAETTPAVDGTEPDWPAIEPILRSLDLPPPFAAEWLLEQQAAFREELNT